MSETNKVVSVDEGCIETYPCQHTVFFSDGSSTTMFSSSIAKLLREQGSPIPSHFQGCDDCDDCEECEE